jgi:hypothetical protein
VPVTTPPPGTLNAIDVVRLAVEFAQGIDDVVKGNSATGTSRSAGIESTAQASDEQVAFN